MSGDRQGGITINGDDLTIGQVIAVSRNYAHAEIDEQGIEKMAKSRQIIEDILERNQIVYGITTGFGSLSNVYIPPGDSSQLQKNLIMSHAAGVGEPLPTEIVRAMMLLRANSLAKGYSGVRPEVVQLLVDMLNQKIHPVVPSKGSVGASGDLIPLSHVALAMIGLGEVEYRQQIMDAQQAFALTGLTPIVLTAKEGLALINGTQYMSSLGCHAINSSQKLLKNALIAAALTMEALSGNLKAFDSRIHAVRPHPGQKRVALAVNKLMEGSDAATKTPEKIRVQDAYSLRCIPQVLGASLDAIEYVKQVLEREINSATDNPLVFPEDEAVISGGNFHGQPLALALDYLAMAIAEIGNISERRTERLVNTALGGLPPYLVRHNGLNSGLMLAQYAAAALVSENKITAHPASVDSIPTSGNQEDHVSMGSISAYKVHTILRNVQWVVAIEILAACQGMDFAEHSPGKGTAIAHRLVREAVPHWKEDRVLYRDIGKVYELVAGGQLLDEVENAIGDLLEFKDEVN